MIDPRRLQRYLTSCSNIGSIPNPPGPSPQSIHNNTDVFLKVFKSEEVVIRSLPIRFIIKMEFSSGKAVQHYQTASKTSNRKYTLIATSPQNPPSFQNSPNTPKPPLDPSQKENTLSTPTLNPTPTQYLRSSHRDMLVAQEIDHLTAKHRMEVELLLMDIGKLQGLLCDSQEAHQLELQRVRDEYENNTHLQLSNLKHSQFSQAELYQHQIRKLKEQLADRADDYKKLELQFTREKQYYEGERDNLKQEVMRLIEKKNAELYELKRQAENRLQQVESDRDSQISEIRQVCEKELATLCRNLQKRQEELQLLRDSNGKSEKERGALLEEAERERQLIERRYEQRITEQQTRYEHLRSNLNKLVCQTSDNEQKNWADLQALFNSEYNKLFDLVKAKDSQASQLRRLLQSQSLAHRSELQTLREQNQHLQTRIKSINEQSQQDMQLLKVKMAALHEGDIKQLKELYDLKLKHTLENLGKLDHDNGKLREKLHQSNAEKYEMKKKFEVSLSQANAKTLRLRLGLTSLESDYKQKIQNEKSLMLMTSRSFLKEAEVKTNNNKFLEEEIRKLRQLMDLQGRQNENAQKAVQEKILAANNELERLSNKIVLIAREKKELEAAMEQLTMEKNAEIARMREEIKMIEKPEYNINEELKLIEELKQDRNAKLEEIGILKDKMGALESRIKEMQAEAERLQMQSQINQEQARKQYHQIAESHLVQFRKFYEEKLNRVQEEKEQLKKIIGSQYEQITELIKRYKELEEGMKEAVQMMRKRTQLEEKVVLMGMDNNLVANLAQLLPKHAQL